MTEIQVTVRGQSATAVASGPVTSGTVGMPVHFVFDESWEGLAKSAVFRAGTVERDMVNIDRETTVPWEVLVTPGYKLEIGVWGVDQTGAVQIPTVWASGLLIEQGATPAGENSPEPTPSEIQQLMAKAQEAVAVANSVKEAAEEGEFDGKPGPAGAQGQPGEQGTPGKDISPIIGEASGVSPELGNCVSAPLEKLIIYGKSTQDGVPTPSDPVAIESVGDSGAVTVTAAGGEGETSSATFVSGLPLRGIPVYAGGNVSIGGQQYISDTLEINADGTGRVVSQITSLIVSDLRGYGHLSNGNAYMACLAPLKAFRIAGILSDRATSVRSFAENTVYENPGNVCFVGNADDTAESMKAKFEGAELLYVLAEPVVTELTAEEVQVFLAMRTCAPATTVSNDAGAEMSVAYLVNTQAYVDQAKAAAIKSATEAFEKTLKNYLRVGGERDTSLNVPTSGEFGLKTNTVGTNLLIAAALQKEIDEATSNYKPIVPLTLDYAVRKALTANKYTLTEAQQALAKDWLGVVDSIRVLPDDWVINLWELPEGFYKTNGDSSRFCYTDIAGEEYQIYVTGSGVLVQIEYDGDNGSKRYTIIGDNKIWTGITKAAGGTMTENDLTKKFSSLSDISKIRYGNFSKDYKTVIPNNTLFLAYSTNDDLGTYRVEDQVQDFPNEYSTLIGMKAGDGNFIIIAMKGGSIFSASSQVRINTYAWTPAITAGGEDLNDKNQPTHNIWWLGNTETLETI